MINKLRGIFFKSDFALIASGGNPLSNQLLSSGGFSVNSSYFIDKSTGLGFIFTANSGNYSKGSRRRQFAWLLLFAIFYPLLGLYALHSRGDLAWGDVLRAIIFYVPLCLGIVVISSFGLFCPLRAVTLVYNLEHGLLGKGYFTCMHPLIFNCEQNLFSAQHARIASLRQRIIINVLLIMVLLVVRFSPVFMWLKSKVILSLVLSLAASNIVMFAVYFAFSAAIFASTLLLIGTIHASNLTAYASAKYDRVLAHHVALHVGLLVVVCGYLALMAYSGVLIAAPVLLANIISVMSIGATLLLHYWYFKAEAQDLVRLMLSGEYMFKSEPIVAVLSNRQKLELLERRELSWWSNIYFRFTGRGKVRALIASYHLEIEAAYKDYDWFSGIYTCTVITASMANLMAKIRRVNNEVANKGDKDLLQQQLKQAYLEANGAVAVQIYYNYSYNSSYQNLCGTYEGYLKLLDEKKGMIELEMKKDYAECGYEASALSFDQSLAKYMGVIKGLHAILSIKDDLGSYEDEAYAEPRRYKQSLGEDSSVLLLPGREEIRATWANFDRKGILQKELGAINSHRQYIEKKLEAIRAVNQHAKNSMLLEMASCEHKLLASSWLYSGYYCYKLRALYVSHYNLPADIFTGSVVRELAVANQAIRARAPLYDDLIAALVLKLSKLESLKLESAEVLLQPDIANKEILDQAKASYKERLSKTRLKFGEQLLAEAENKGISSPKRFMARFRYYIGGYFIKANIIHVIFYACCAIKNNLSQNVALVCSSYQKKYSIDFVYDSTDSNIKAFLLPCLISLLQCFVDLVCFPVFACCSFLLSLYNSYKLWLPSLDRPKFSYILLSMLFTIIIVALQIVIDAICLPLFAVSYPVYCSFYYLSEAYNKSYKELLLKELHNLSDNQDDTQAKIVGPGDGVASLDLEYSGDKGDDNHPVWLDNTGVDESPVWLDKESVGSSSNSAFFDVGGEGGSDRCEV
jgi:hypothetical protein